MTIVVISSPPSPYARKVRIALKEKKIPFEDRMETPWDQTTDTPSWNPLEKLPILIEENGTDCIYESHLIMEYIDLKYPQPPNLTPEDIDAMLLAKKIEVVADGVCDALILEVWETRREKSRQSPEWAARQRRKVDGGLRAVEDWVKKANGGFLVGSEFGLADISVGSMLGFLNYRSETDEWQKKYPESAEYWGRLEKRPSFVETAPGPFPNGGIQDKIV